MFKKWKKQIVEKIELEYQCYRFGCGLVDSLHKDGYNPTKWGFIKQQARLYWDELLCKVLGHKWVASPHFTTESGNKLMYCDRCGETNEPFIIRGR